MTDHSGWATRAAATASRTSGVTPARPPDLREPLRGGRLGVPGVIEPLALDGARQVLLVVHVPGRVVRVLVAAPAAERARARVGGRAQRGGRELRAVLADVLARRAQRLAGGVG